MNLLKIGNRVLNLDNVALIDLSFGFDAAHPIAIRVFGNCYDPERRCPVSWDFVDDDAEALRNWLAVNSMRPYDRTGTASTNY